MNRKIIVIIFCLVGILVVGSLGVYGDVDNYPVPMEKTGQDLYDAVKHIYYLTNKNSEEWKVVYGLSFQEYKTERYFSYSLDDWRNKNTEVINVMKLVMQSYICSIYKFRGDYDKAYENFYDELKDLIKKYPDNKLLNSYAHTLSPASQSRICKGHVVIISDFPGEYFNFIYTSTEYNGAPITLRENIIKKCFKDRLEDYVKTYFDNVDIDKRFFSRQCDRLTKNNCAFVMQSA